MAADSNIFQQYLKAPKSMQEYSDEANASQMQQQAMQKNALELQATQQSQQRANALRDLVTNMPADPAQRVKALRAANTPESWQAADALEKSQAEIGFKQAEANKHTTDAESKKLQQGIDKHNFALQKLQTVNDTADAHAWAAEQYANGTFTREQYMQGLANIPTDPAQVQAWKQKALQGGVTVLDNLKIQHEDLRNALNNDTSRKNNQETNATSRANNAASNSVTMRGQNMTDARTRESNAATMSKPFEVTGPDGNPMLVQQTKQGEIVPVKGYAPKSADKPLTDSQSKAALFGSRMESSGKVIDDLAKAGTITSVPGSRAGYGVGSVVNAVSSGNQQKLDQAKRDFVNAVMRRESGAVISDSEFSNAEKQYFPQIGDSDAVIKQKAQNRAIATRGIQAEVPKAQRGILKEIQGSGGDIHAQADAILRGK